MFDAVREILLGAANGLKIGMEIGSRRAGVVVCPPACRFLTLGRHVPVPPCFRLVHLNAGTWCVARQPHIGCPSPVSALVAEVYLTSVVDARAIHRCRAPSDCYPNVAVRSSSSVSSDVASPPHCVQWSTWRQLLSNLVPSGFSSTTNDSDSGSISTP